MSSDAMDTGPESHDYDLGVMDLDLDNISMVSMGSIEEYSGHLTADKVKELGDKLTAAQAAQKAAEDTAQGLRTENAELKGSLEQAQSALKKVQDELARAEKEKKALGESFQQRKYGMAQMCTLAKTFPLSKNADFSEAVFPKTQAPAGELAPWYKMVAHTIQSHTALKNKINSFYKEVVGGSAKTLDDMLLDIKQRVQKSGSVDKTALETFMQVFTYDFFSLYMAITKHITSIAVIVARLNHGVVSVHRIGTEVADLSHGVQSFCDALVAAVSSVHQSLEDACDEHGITKLPAWTAALLAMQDQFKAGDHTAHGALLEDFFATTATVESETAKCIGMVDAPDSGVSTKYLPSGYEKLLPYSVARHCLKPDPASTSDSDRLAAIDSLADMRHRPTPWETFDLDCWRLLGGIKLPYKLAANGKLKIKTRPSGRPVKAFQVHGELKDATSKVQLGHETGQVGQEDVMKQQQQAATEASKKRLGATDAVGKPFESPQSPESAILIKPEN